MKGKKYKCPAKAPGCHGDYVKFNSFKKTCDNPACAIHKAVADREKAEKHKRSKNRRELREFNLANRTIAGWCKWAREDGFQPWVRLRDKGDGCISCGSKTKPSYHAGHFMSVGSRPELQFHPANCHKQCSGCNQSRKSISHKYRARLVDKVGLRMVEYLENYHAVTKLTVEEIKGIRSHFQELIKELKR